MEIVDSIRAASRLRAARMRLVAREPFFGSLVLNFRTKDVGNAVSTMRTNAKDLQYNPQFVLRLSDEHLDFVYAHEAMHCALEHNLRRGERDRKLWNIACDYVVNRDLIQSGFVPPPGAFDDPRLDNMSAEEIYDLLEEQEKKEKKPKQQGKQEAQGGGKGDSSQSGKSAKGGGTGKQEKGKDDKGKESGGSGKPESSKDEKDEAGEEKEGKAGDADENEDEEESEEKDSGESDDDDEDERPGDDPGQCGAVFDTDKEDEEEVQEQWAESVKNAEAITRMLNPGKLPGSMRREEDAPLEKPRVDWKTLLRRFVDRAVARDYSFSRPNRRHFGSDILMPGRVPDNPSHVVAIVDTSGSISARTLGLFREQLQNMLDDNAMDKLTIGCADTHLYRDHVVSFKSGELIQFEKVGGGGTDFGDAMKWATSELDEHVTAIVYLTDMATSNFGNPKDTPVLWAIAGARRIELNAWASQAKFGEKVWLEDS